MTEELTCNTVREVLWDSPAESPNIAAHLDACRDCTRHGREIRSLQTGLKSLPPVQVPALLTTRLMIAASRDRSRRLARRDFSQWLKTQRSRARLLFDNLFRPFALPAAGGILTSFLCFGTIIDTLQVSPHWDSEIPIGMSTEVKIDELSPFCAGNRDVMVQLTVDATGHVTDYNLPSDSATDEVKQEIGSLVLYSTFTPATRFGVAVSSKRLLFISHMSVKG